MSIIYPVYYVVTTREELHKLALQHNITDLTENDVWFAEESGPPSSNPFYIFRFKLVFLAVFRKRNMEEVSSLVLGQPPYSVELFDKWWTVERLSWGSNFSAALDWLSESDMEVFAKTGNDVVDNWFPKWFKIKSENSKNNE